MRDERDPSVEDSQAGRRGDDRARRGAVSIGVSAVATHAEKSDEDHCLRPPKLLRVRAAPPSRRYTGQPIAGAGRDTSRVRKQYHFWPGEKQLDAWDVERLIAMSASFPVEEVSLAAIWEVDTVYWFDDREQPTVRKLVEHARLIQEVDMTYPIILGPDGRVMDGMHRVARALLEDHETIRAVRFAVLPEADFRDCHPDELPY